MGRRIKGVVGTPLAGFTKTEYDRSELRPWVRFAFVGEHGGAVRVRDADSNLTGEEVNAACNTTIVLAKMRRMR